MSIDGKSRKPTLCMCRHNCCQIHRTRALRSVESPDSFDGVRIHIESLCSVTPTGRHRQGCYYIFHLKLFCHPGRLRTSSDSGTADHALYRCSIRILQILRDQFCGNFCHFTGLILQAFTNATPTSIDYRANSNLRVSHNYLSFSICIMVTNL